MHPRQQRRIAPRRRCIDRHSLFRTKAVQIMRAARFGASAAQAFSTKRRTPTTAPIMLRLM